MAGLQKYVDALEAKLLELGFSGDELAALKATSLPEDDVRVAEPLPAKKDKFAAFEARMELMKAKGQDSVFTLPVAVRLKDVDFHVTVEVGADGIETVLTENPIGKMVAGAMAAYKGGKKKVEKHILKKVTGTFAPSTLSLVLGPPASGKTSLLKLVAGQLHQIGGARLEIDECSYNGDSIYGKGLKMVPSKVAAYMDQIDRHSPALTVEETLKFAFMTYGGGTLMKSVDEAKAKGDYVAVPAGPLDRKISAVLEILGIAHVRKTIVGNATMRGVSGGRRPGQETGDSTSLQRGCSRSIFREGIQALSSPRLVQK